MVAYMSIGEITHIHLSPVVSSSLFSKKEREGGSARERKPSGSNKMESKYKPHQNKWL